MPKYLQPLKSRPVTPRRVLRKVLSRLLWHLPGRERLANRVAGGYGLRCVLFHHVCESEDEFTAGLRVTVHPEEFQSCLTFLSRNYDLVTLDDILSSSPLPNRALLVTFDDTYRSVAVTAAPIARALRVPLVCFVNSAYIDSARLALDNLVAYVVNTKGFPTLLKAADCRHIPDLRELVGGYLPSLSWGERLRFEQRLAECAGVDATELGRAAGIYLSASELRSLADAGVEIGNHTATHVHCRGLDHTQARTEIVECGTRLQEITGKSVRAFSVPYGSIRDATPGVLSVLRESGYQAVFLVEAGMNREPLNRWGIRRVSLKAESDPESWFEIEMMPRWNTHRGAFHDSSATR